MGDFSVCDGQCTYRNVIGAKFCIALSHLPTMCSIQLVYTVETGVGGPISPTHVFNEVRKFHDLLLQRVHVQDLQYVSHHYQFLF